MFAVHVFLWFSFQCTHIIITTLKIYGHGFKHHIMNTYLEISKGDVCIYNPKDASMHQNIFKVYLRIFNLKLLTSKFLVTVDS